MIQALLGPIQPSPDLFSAQLVLKIVVLIAIALYGIFSSIVYLQVRRLESWLKELRLYHFSHLMLVQLVMVALGFLFAAIAL